MKAMKINTYKNLKELEALLVKLGIDEELWTPTKAMKAEETITGMKPSRKLQPQPPSFPPPASQHHQYPYVWGQRQRLDTDKEPVADTDKDLTELDDLLLELKSVAVDNKSTDLIWL